MGKGRERVRGCHTRETYPTFATRVEVRAAVIEDTYCTRFWPLEWIDIMLGRVGCEGGREGGCHPRLFAILVNRVEGIGGLIVMPQTPTRFWRLE